MKRKTWILRLGLCLAFVLVVALTCRVTVIPDEVPVTYVNEAGESVVMETLSVADQYCLDNWDTRVIPTVHERAVDVATFLMEIREDKDKAGEVYGSRSNETSPWSFCIAGQVKVLAIEDADKPNKTQLLLDVAPYDGTVDCKLHFGKVFASNIKNAIRDGVGFLKLDNFANQVEFAELTTSFNNKVKEAVFAAHDPQALVGREIVFYGCISIQDVDVDSLVIVPVELTVVGG